MLRALVGTCVVAGCLALVPSPSSAQEIIHALTGTISSINGATKTITVLQDFGSSGTYQELSNPKTRVSFDKHMEADTTAAEAFDKQGAYVIVFYFGTDNDRTAVAFKNLGAGPFQSTEGTVTHFDGHARALTVQDESGKEQTFKIDAGTVAETGVGAVPGLKLQAEKGDKVRIVSSKGEGAPTALFVRDL